MSKLNKCQFCCYILCSTTSEQVKLQGRKKFDENPLQRAYKKYDSYIYRHAILVIQHFRTASA